MTKRREKKARKKERKNERIDDREERQEGEKERNHTFREDAKLLPHCRQLCMVWMRTPSERWWKRFTCDGRPARENGECVQRLLQT